MAQINTDFRDLKPVSDRFRDIKIFSAVICENLPAIATLRR
jgi:hypothetical protein